MANIFYSYKDAAKERGVDLAGQLRDHFRATIMESPHHQENGHFSFPKLVGALQRRVGVYNRYLTQLFHEHGIEADAAQLQRDEVRNSDKSYHAHDHAARDADYESYVVDKRCLVLGSVFDYDSEGKAIWPEDGYMYHPSPTAKDLGFRLHVTDVSNYSDYGITSHFIFVQCMFSYYSEEEQITKTHLYARPACMTNNTLIGWLLQHPEGQHVLNGPATAIDITDHDHWHWAIGTTYGLPNAQRMTDVWRKSSSSDYNSPPVEVFVGVLQKLTLREIASKADPIEGYEKPIIRSNSTQNAFTFAERYIERMCRVVDELAVTRGVPEGLPGLDNIKMHLASVVARAMAVGFVPKDVAARVGGAMEGKVHGFDPIAEFDALVHEKDGEARYAQHVHEVTEANAIPLIRNADGTHTTKTWQEMTVKYTDVNSWEKIFSFVGCAVPHNANRREDKAGRLIQYLLRDKGDVYVEAWNKWEEAYGLIYNLSSSSMKGQKAFDGLTRARDHLVYIHDALTQAMQRETPENRAYFESLASNLLESMSLAIEGLSDLHRQYRAEYGSR